MSDPVVQLPLLGPPRPLRPGALPPAQPAAVPWARLQPARVQPAGVRQPVRWEAARPQAARTQSARSQAARIQAVVRFLQDSRIAPIRPLDAAPLQFPAPGRSV